MERLIDLPINLMQSAGINPQITIDQGARSRHYHLVEPAERDLQCLLRATHQLRGATNGRQNSCLAQESGRS